MFSVGGITFLWFGFLMDSSYGGLWHPHGRDSRRQIVPLNSDQHESSKQVPARVYEG